MNEARAESSPRNEVLIVVLVTVAAVVLLYVRAPFAPQKLWAEDGRDFLGDAIRLGPIQSLGQDRQAGYYILGSRLGGVLASLVPLRAAAITMWLWVATVTAWLVATVAVSSRTWLRTWPSRIVLALGLVLLPVFGTESIANAANLQVLMLFASVIVLIGQPRTRAEQVNGCAVLVVTGLTTTVAALLIPLAVYRLFRTRRFRWDPLAISWAAGIALQWIAIAIGRPDPTPREGDAWWFIARRIWRAGLGENFIPFDPPDSLAPVVILAFVVLLGAGTWVAWRDGQRQRALWLVVLPAFGIGLFVIMGAVSGAPARYLVTPVLILVWAVLAAAETLAAHVATARSISTSAIMAVVGALLIVVWLPRWTPSEQRRSGPTWDEGIARARTQCAGRSPDTDVRIQIAPLDDENRGQWTVLVACRDL